MYDSFRPYLLHSKSLTVSSRVKLHGKTASCPHFTFTVFGSVRRRRSSQSVHSHKVKSEHEHTYIANTHLVSLPKAEDTTMSTKTMNISKGTFSGLS